MFIASTVMKQTDLMNYLIRQISLDSYSGKLSRLKLTLGLHPRHLHLPEYYGLESGGADLDYDKITLLQSLDHSVQLLETDLARLLPARYA